MTKISKDTFTFLKELIANNDRDWFNTHKNRYEQAKQNALDFTEELLKGIKKIDPSIPEDLQAKKCVLRIYRDVRFSKNKAPYKSNIGISISSDGRGGTLPGYYIHIEPEKSFVAGGYWMPEAQHLKAIRQEIDYNTSDFLDIIEAKDFKNYFGGLSTEDQLKNAPKDYPKDHPYVHILKLKSFICSKSFTDEEMTKDNILETIVEGMKLIYPLNKFIKEAITA
jgi:uncharacterized protein (TIGR02453 family)